MRADKRKRLEAAGWRVGSVAEYLGLSEEESRIIDMKLALAEAVRRRRQRLGWTQTKLATRFGSSQSRLAKLEAGDSDVSMELLLTAFLSTGATQAEVGQLLSSHRNALAHASGAWDLVGSFTCMIAWATDPAETPDEVHWPAETPSRCDPDSLAEMSRSSTAEKPNAVTPPLSDLAA